MHVPCCSDPLDIFQTLCFKNYPAQYRVFRIFWKSFSCFFFQYKMRYLVLSKKKNRVGSNDHRLSSFCNPRDANWWSSGWIFLSHPHTHDIFLYYISSSEKFHFCSRKYNTCLWNSLQFCITAMVNLGNLRHQVKLESDIACFILQLG